MKLQVKNLGPIRQGEIDLDKRFYVFVGYNNSGKTYMAQVVWTVLDYFHTALISEKIVKVETTLPTKLSELNNKNFNLDDDFINDMIRRLEDELKKQVIDTFNSTHLEKGFSLKLKNAFNILKNKTIIVNSPCKTRLS